MRRPRTLVPVAIVIVDGVIRAAPIADPTCACSVFARRFPRSRFTGIDLAHSAIQRGQPLIEHLGLRNCRLVHGDLRNIDAAWGEFDYIIAHGVYAWVAQDVRDRLLAVCRERLAPRGLAFISYAALPGAHLSLMLREMLLRHAARFADPVERMHEAFGMARLIAGARRADEPNEVWLRTEAERIVKKNEPAQLFHDELAPDYAPVYFEEFAAHALRHGLKFVGEAEVEETAENRLSAEAREVLEKLAGNPVAREQYRDFLKGRRFRQSIVTPAENSPLPMPDSAALSGMWIDLLMPLTAAHGDLRRGVMCRFDAAGQGHFEIDVDLGKALLFCLIEERPHAVAQRDLLAGTLDRLRAAGIAIDPLAHAESALNGLLLYMAQQGVLGLHSWWPRLPRAPGPQPAASPIARWQIRQSPEVATLFHRTVKMEGAIGQTLIEMLDGSRQQGALADAMFDELLRRGSIDRARAGDEERREFREQLTLSLQKLADLGLLVQ